MRCASSGHLTCEQREVGQPHAGRASGNGRGMSEDEDLFSPDGDFLGVDGAVVLAKQAGIPVRDFVEVFGAAWDVLPLQHLDLDADPADSGTSRGPWLVTGEPYQLMLRIWNGGMELGMPKGRWIGVHDLWYRPEARHSFDLGLRLLDEAAPVVENLLRRRRRSFRYCRYCRRQTGPENRLSDDCCHACASVWRGVVY